MREKMLWWLALAKKKMWRWIASFGDSYHGDVLQFEKQLFSVRLPKMTKFFVMRECDNILSSFQSVPPIKTSYVDVVSLNHHQQQLFDEHFTLHLKNPFVFTR
jgi:hypothetical protein